MLRKCHGNPAIAFPDTSVMDGWKEKEPDGWTLLHNLTARGKTHFFLQTNLI